MTECRNCHRDLTVDVRTYSCFPNLCGDCVDRLLGIPAGMVEQRTGFVHRVTLAPEQIADVEQRERDRAELEELREQADTIEIDQFNHVVHDPLWAPIDRSDALLIMQCVAGIFPAYQLQLTQLELMLRRRWKKPEPEGVHG